MSSTSLFRLISFKIQMSLKSYRQLCHPSSLGSGLSLFLDEYRAEILSGSLGGTVDGEVLG